MRSLAGREMRTRGTAMNPATMMPIGKKRTVGSALNGFRSEMRPNLWQQSPRQGHRTMSPPMTVLRYMRLLAAHVHVAAHVAAHVVGAV